MYRYIYIYIYLFIHIHKHIYIYIYIYIYTANLPANIVDFGGSDISIILIIRVEFPGPWGISRKV